MKLKSPVIALTLIFAALAIPLLISTAQAFGCSPTCNFDVTTNVPISEGAIMVRVDGSTVYTLNQNSPFNSTAPGQRFAFSNDTVHSIQVLNVTFYGASGAKYIWRQWNHVGTQWDTNNNMTTPRILADFTLPTQQYIAEFEKQFPLTLTFTDPSGQTVSPPSSVALSGPPIIPGTPSYSVVLISYQNQFLPATHWTVTDATWEGISGLVCGCSSSSLPTADLSQGSTTAIIQLKAYSATIRVTDNANNPIPAVAITVTFVNGTSRSFTTDNQGMAKLGYVPLGPYNAHIKYQNQDQSYTVDASSTPVDTIKLDTGGQASAPVVSALVLLTIFGIAAFLLVLAIKVRKPPPPPIIG